MQRTRRQVVLAACGLAVSAWGGLNPHRAEAATKSASHACLTPEGLLRDLRALCGQLDPRTSVAFCDLRIGTGDEGVVTVDLGLHLVWSPGERRVPYSATAPDAHRALTALRDRIAADLVALHRPSLRVPSRSGQQMDLSWT